MKHELKTDSAIFHDVRVGEKTFEIRKNDRNYQVGDTLLLRETAFTGNAMATLGAPLKYTGDELTVTVKYVMAGPSFGLASDWCIMSIAL